jgi:hypothetical protein
MSSAFTGQAKIVATHRGGLRNESAQGSCRELAKDSCQTLSAFPSQKEEIYMASPSISCQKPGCGPVIEIPNKRAIDKFFNDMVHLYRASTSAGDSAAQYWADIAVKSQHPLAPLANIPGVFAALWTPEVAPTTAITLATAGYGFAALPKNLVHFTTAAGAGGITTSATINATRFGLFGPGAYMAAVGRPLNLFVRAAARVPISLATPAGTARIIPYLVYVRWGLAPIVLP